MNSITFEDDTWKKGGGATKFNSSAVTGADPEIRAMHHFRMDDGTEELVCKTPTRIITVGTGGLVKSLLGPDVTHSHAPFVEGFDGTSKAIYYFAGFANASPYVYTGGAIARPLGASVGTVTFDHTTDTWTRTSHGLANGTAVHFTSTGSLPTGLAVLGNPLYVVNTAANTFQASLTIGGSVENFTSNGSGTITVYRNTRATDWNSSPVGPRWGFLHLGRMFAGGNSNRPHGVYVSVLNNHSDFINSGNLFFQVYPGEGDITIGGVSWRNKAYLFKYPSGVYVLDDSDSDTSTWGWRRVSKYVGAISPGAIVEADDEVFFVSPNGYFHALSAVQESGDVRSSAVKGLELGEYIRSNTDFAKLPVDQLSAWLQYPNVQSVYYPRKKKVLFAFSPNPNVISGQSLPTNKTIIGLDLHRSDPSSGIRDVQAFVSTRDECESLALYRNSTTGQFDLLAGASNGFIYRLDQTARTKDAAGYMGTFTTKEFFPYADDKLASMRELQVTFAPGSSNNSIVIKIYQDGTLSTSKTLTDADRRMRLYGDCRKFYIVGENDTNNSSFSVATILVRFQPGNRR
ncbi:MAG: hypothetical protein OEY86_00835 [Nitrospira sp.]|nr:hypothetical protein [Nitrospira sp.]